MVDALPVPAWKGRGVSKARALMGASLPALCAQCGVLIAPGQRWVVGHRQPRALYPELTWEPSNWQLEHEHCSLRSGHEVRREMKRRRAAKSAESVAETGFFGGAASSAGTSAGVALPNTADLAGASSDFAPELPEPSPAWANVEWASRLVDRWESDPAFTWPRLLTEPHPDAVGTYGWRAAEWAEDRRRQDSRVPATAKGLRGFQLLRLVLGLQHDAEGRLLIGTRLESTPRQQGKSVGLSEEALWRTHAADLFGEEQLVMHTAKDLAVAREVQREARLWAADKGYTVRGTHGQEEIEHGDGSRWLIRGRESVYSYSAGFAIVDEAWGVDPSVVDDGLEPTLVEREGGQLLLISTAHRRASSLFPERRRAAIRQLAVPGGRSTLAEWSAPPDRDSLDPVTWRIASAHWTDRRRAFLLDKAGRPGWREQWLNVWPGMHDDTSPELWLSRAQLAGAQRASVHPQPGTPLMLAVEVSDTHRCWAVSGAWTAANGQVALSVHGGHGGLSEALTRARALAEEFPGGRLWAHLSVAARIPPDFPAPPVNMKQSDAASATALFRDLVLEQNLRFAGNVLPEQIENVATRTLDGRELVDQSRSRGPVPAVKAAAWAAWAASVAGVESAAIF